MRRSAKAAWTLLIVATILPELVTGSTSIFKFFDPFTLFILFIGYGVTILAMREISVRLGFNHWGLFLFGMGYAVINEGLLAKTFILSTGLPLGQFNNYGYIAGISFPWALGISMWHAFASVVFPILFVYMKYPDQKKTPWIDKYSLGAIIFFLATFSGLFFFGNLPVKGTVSQYIILIFMMALWFLIANIFGKKNDNEEVVSPSIKPFFLGLSVFITNFTILPFLAQRKVPLVIFLLAVILIIWFFARTLKRGGWTGIPDLIMFGAGFYTQQAVLGIILGVAFGNSVLIATDIILFIFFLIFTIRMRRTPVLAV